jgi:hypothetical protein
MMRSSSDGDLYSFGPSKLTTPLALTACSPSVEVWHRHLGHPDHPSLASLISIFSFLVQIKQPLVVFVMLVTVVGMFGYLFLVPLPLHIFHSK